MNLLRSAFLAALCAFTITGCRSFPAQGLVAHRGDCADFPESTRPALISAVRKGAEMIEIDEWRCKTGELVVLHDGKVDRTTNGSGAVSDLTLEQIKALDAGIKQGTRFRGERVLTLGEALECFPKTGLLLNIHCKTGSAAPEVAELLRKTGRRDQGILMMGSRSDLVELRKRCPWARTGLVLVQDAGWGLPWSEAEAERKLQDAVGLGVEFVQLVPNGYCSRRQLRFLREHSVRTVFYAADSEEEMRRMVLDGYDFIFTNRLSDLRPAYESAVAERGRIP